MTIIYKIKTILLFMSNYLEHCVPCNTSVIGDIKQLAQILSCQAALLMHLKRIHRNQQLLFCCLMPKYKIHPQYSFHVLQVYIMNYQGCLIFISREVKYSLSGNTYLIITI